ncbi:REPEAT-CONTAINING PROTEIN putative-RELATED [Salix koriyanagi]|uniref:REPEAT-CONTAINING PROTEIN putative-RELATED n=1 Tax=Salix koriyanagi TaxID=2511006 RepID=A0A9Q0Z6H3_9ROSI|nr:REPEAT-CONTAINING PROTEIN putative-RELATED [Salix koriyanagi]
MHAQIIKKGNEWNSDSMAKHLITSYLDLGDYKAAAMVFFVGFARNYVMWNDFLEEFKSFGGDPSEVLEVFKELRCEGVVFDSRVISVVLKICASVMNLWLGLEVHASLIKRGFELDVYVKCALMSFYGRCWRVESANQVFHESPNLDDLLWNEAILVNLKNERFVKALELFREMQFLSSKVNATAVLKILQACSKEGALNEGKQIHGNGKIKIASRVFDSMKDHSLSSWNSIISSYTTLGYLDDAWNLFCKMERSGTKPDIVTWNSILSGNAIVRSYKEVLITLLRMQAAGFRPNPRSITSVLQAVNELGLLNFGKEIHGYVIRNGLDYDAYVGTSLLDMYVKNDCLTSSQAFFDNMKNKNIVAWNSLISGYSFKGHFDDAKRLLNRMKVEGIKPDLITLNSLVAGYSMCGHTKEALALIHDIKILGLTPNVVSWTALISGCSQNGYYTESFEFFVQMQEEGIKPNSATISSLLRTCGGLSLLQKGKEIHCLSIRKGFIEDVYVATALIDTYSKSGDLESAQEVFRSAEKTLASWNCMIMGFAINGCGREAIALLDGMQGTEIAAKKLFKLEPYNSANYVLMLSLYAMSNRWEDVDRIKDLMDTRGIKPRQVWSWIQIDQRVNLFSTGGIPHQDEGEIYYELYQLFKNLHRNSVYSFSNNGTHHNKNLTDSGRGILGSSFSSIQLG